MLLAVDVGNSTTTLGVYQGADLVAWAFFATGAGEHGPAEAAKALRALPRGPSIGFIQRVAVCCVAERAAEGWRRETAEVFNTPAIMVTHASFPDLPIRYDSPSSVGQDRLANVLAAREKYGAPAIVVDLGTATNFDVLSVDGAFIGGAIAPGLGTAANALLRDAPRLRMDQYEAPGRTVGGSTRACLESGIVLGHAAMVDGMIDRMKREVGPPARVIATGGWAELVSHVSECIDVVDYRLTLDGIRLVSEINRPPLMEMP